MCVGNDRGGVLEHFPLRHGHIPQQRSSLGTRSGVKMSVAWPMASQSSVDGSGGAALEVGLEL